MMMIFAFAAFNSMAQETENISKEKVLNKKVTEVFPGIEEMGLLDIFRQVHKSGNSEIFEMAFYQDERISGWRKNTVVKLDEIHIMALYENIDIKKELDIQKDTISQMKKSAKLGTWTLDIENNILIWDNETYKIFDINNIDSIAKLDDFYNAIHPDDVQRVSDLYNNHLENKTLYNIKYRLRIKNGKIKHVKERCDTVFDSNGKPIVSYGTIQDITKRKKQKRAIKKKDELILEQSKLAQMGEMLNMIAHQWRQPLNALSASAINLSLKNELDMLDKESVNEISKFVQSKAQDMSKIIDDFMEFNKPEKNKEFSLFESVSKVINIISPQLENRAITLEVDVDKDIKVFHNSKSVEHVLLNLIINSRDAFEDWVPLGIKMR